MFCSTSHPTTAESPRHIMSTPIPTIIENPITLNLTPSYGALLIAIYFSCVLWGVNVFQTYVYYWNYPGDSWTTKILVAFLLIVDTAHKILVTKVPWSTLIQNWGNVAAIQAAPVEALHEAWVGSIIILIVQLYYLRRIGKFASHTRHARSWWLWLALAVLVGLAILQVPMTVVYCIDSISKNIIFNVPINLRIKRTGLIAAAVVDVFIAVAMILLLKDTDSADGQFKSKRTSKTIRRLTVIIVNTGLVTAVVTIVALILDKTASGTDFWTTIAQYPQCSIYFSTFLANLNARRYVGSDVGEGLSNIGDIHFASSPSVSQRNGDLETGLGVPGSRHIVLNQADSDVSRSEEDPEKYEEPMQTFESEVLKNI
ncbi:hypothetical protein FB45DRAFT_895900 [Roridomyces roridus]|uniref:DUF6534 domain-containing protein n=1 Tax=Roridomyces roridus TaxID=1738132 RepID=A0AAD7FXJ0_9AGAR|nr:hypothetical protein FB45DRAFT_895900 [Roridomyces roridus]